MDKNIKLLLVEDDENISSILIDILTSKNFDVTHAADGQEALNTALAGDFDLILLDEMLPSMHGSEILVRIKANSSSAHIPIIMLTSLKDENHQIATLQDGADDYLTKPCRLNILMARIESVLRRAQSGPKLDIEIPKNIRPETISPKEIEVLSYIVKGYNNNRIAEEMVISESTVANHLKSIYNKLNIESRTQAAILALKLKLI